MFTVNLKIIIAFVLIIFTEYNKKNKNRIRTSNQHPALILTAIVVSKGEKSPFSLSHLSKLVWVLFWGTLYVSVLHSFQTDIQAADTAVVPACWSHESRHVHWVLASETTAAVRMMVTRSWKVPKQCVNECLLWMSIINSKHYSSNPAVAL